MEETFSNKIRLCNFARGASYEPDHNEFNGEVDDIPKETDVPSAHEVRVPTRLLQDVCSTLQAHPFWTGCCSRLRLFNSCSLKPLGSLVGLSGLGKKLSRSEEHQLSMLVALLLLVISRFFFLRIHTPGYFSSKLCTDSEEAGA